MKCPQCSAEISAGVKFCGACGSSVTKACNLCGAQQPIGSQFCTDCGTNLADAVLGIPLPRALQWREMFGSIGWVEEPDPKWRAKLKELLLTLDINLTADTIDSHHAPLFLTRIRDADWRIYDFQIDGKVVESPRARNRKLFMMGGLSAVMIGKMTSTEQTWVIGLRDRLVLANLKDGQVTSWQYSDFADAYANSDGRFGFSAGDANVEFRVKKKSTAFMMNYLIAQAIDSSPLTRFYVVERTRERQASNMELMSGLGHYLDEALAVGAANLRNR